MSPRLGEGFSTNGDLLTFASECVDRSVEPPQPRIIDPSGIPLHKDNQSIIKERIYLDKADPNVLRDQITVIDHAFTKPWTVTRSYQRAAKTVWTEHCCGQNNDWIFIEGESYMVGIDGKLYPSRKDQPPPDLRYFGASQK